MGNTSPRWYSRTWIVQEYCLATAAYFCFGNDECNSNGVAGPEFNEFAFGKLRWYWQLMYRVEFFDALRMPRLGGPVTSVQPGPSLCQALEATIRSYGISDDRDKVYSLLRPRVGGRSAAHWV